MKDKIIKIEAKGDFPFSFYIEKAVPSGDEENMTIKGVASTVNIDHDNERMAEGALKAMAEVINEQTVPLRVEHQKDNNSIVGNVFKAWVDERNQLWIEASLDKSHPGASMLYKALKTGAKLGLSVGGRVKHAVREFSESAGKMVKTFYNVVLDEVSVTSRPANYDAWLVSKSIISKEQDGEKFVGSPFYKEFLFENQSLDYMQSFAKSIPNDSWKKVDIKNNLDKNMNEKEVKKDSKEETAEETKEKASANGGETSETGESKPEETANKNIDEAFKSMVMKGFESLTAMMAKLMKGSSTEETKKEEETTIMEEKTKAESKEETTEEEKKKNTEGKKEETETASEKDYHIKTMKSILEKLDGLSKAVEGSETTEEEKKKTESGTKEEETTEKGEGSLDSFVDAITKSIDSLKEKIEKNGKRFPGLTEMIVTALRNDEEVQKCIKDMMGEPGFKKSLSFGAPVIRTKEGKTFRLTATPDGEEVQKSKDDMKGKGFKEVYNSKFSSTAHAVE